MNYLVITDLSGNLKGILHPIDGEIEKTKKILKEFGFRVFRATKDDVDQLAGAKYLSPAARKNPAPALIAKALMYAPMAVKVAKSAVKAAPKALKGAKKAMVFAGEAMTVVEAGKDIVKKGKTLTAKEEEEEEENTQNPRRRRSRHHRGYRK